nr:MAG TPA: hypothetical protein [Bacteriophage sp.]
MVVLWKRIVQQSNVKAMNGLVQYCRGSALNSDEM